ncbi:MAG: uncharacterized protein KVP18_002264 [Porospora cf. gigantea A]|uniref:uncharacterized protein n=2 Tax=Porospora cf. gigantea A TaxID=2853593 RepID=UPI003559A7AE|nr:MAG: hypothetical protein KVP18_002264 [Porospora cf. gigantea A]
MIRVWASDQWHHTLIDCGKTFRDAVLNVFHPLGIAHVDEVLLTHGHKDACGGLDDLRDLQNFSMTPEREYRVSSPLTVVSDHATVMEVQRQFSYMFDASKRPSPAADGSYSMKAKMAVLDLVSLNSPDNAGDIQSRVIPGGMVVTVLPVWHGKGYYCSGFAFGGSERVLYLSDVSEVPSHIMDWIDSHGPWKLIVMDSLRVHTPHFSHMSLSEALKLILKWDPEEARIVGMGCEMNSRETDPQLAMVVASAKGRIRRVTLGKDGEVMKFEC